MKTLAILGAAFLLTGCGQISTPERAGRALTCQSGFVSFTGFEKGESLSDNVLELCTAAVNSPAKKEAKVGDPTWSATHDG